MSTQRQAMRARVFDEPDQLQIAMPMGGIGAGCVCLNGHGGLQDFSIRHQPATTALPDAHGVDQSAFALLHITGDRPVTRLVEGPLPSEKLYDQGLQAQGYRKGGHEGLPRFARCRFTAAYPFGCVELTHPDLPLTATITGFSPFIPLDDHHSSMPCAILRYTLRNVSDAPVDYEFSYHMSHPAPGGKLRDGDRNASIDGFGVAFTNTEPAHAEAFGSAAFGVVGAQPRIKASWARSGWFDWINALWREVSTGTFTQNAGHGDRGLTGHNGGSILLPDRLDPGEEATYPIVLAWHFPNAGLAYGQPDADCGPACDCDAEPAPPKWRPYYAEHWRDAAAVATYVRDHYAELHNRTAAFRDAIASSTVPDEVLDAVTSNLAILQSPTVLRQANGNVWAWEGCFTAAGCCPGSCTHVWNYAQAMPHLFPPLERTLREQELIRSMNEQGHVAFRAALPDGPVSHDFHAAADGQLGGILKLCRDWRIAGDTDWLRRMLPRARRSLDACIRMWDPERRGALFEPHHNTYDIEFWGPDGMCTSIYIGALSAMAEMCEAVGDDAEAASRRELAERGARYMDEHLFNGTYYHQRVMWRELRDQSFAEKVHGGDTADDEMLRIQQAEGPNHQYGNGCLADGVIGAWMAQTYGVNTPINAHRVRTTLASIFRHNFKPDLSDHPCTQRPGYAFGREAGLILCTWPHDDRPTLPFVYSDEVWTGIEYQVASHLIAEGMVDEGLAIVRGVRARYEGHVRNPFNEYECGSYYARAMASYALLGALSGFRYDAVSRTLWLSPKAAKRPFRIFISTATGWGTVALTTDRVLIELVEGELAVRELVVDGAQAGCDVVARGGVVTELAAP